MQALCCNGVLGYLRTYIAYKFASIAPKQSEPRLIAVNSLLLLCLCRLLAVAAATALLRQTGHKRSVGKIAFAEQAGQGAAGLHGLNPRSPESRVRLWSMVSPDLIMCDR